MTRQAIDFGSEISTQDWKTIWNNGLHTSICKIIKYFSFIILYQSYFTTLKVECIYGTGTGKFWRRECGQLGRFYHMVDMS